MYEKAPKSVSPKHKMTGSPLPSQYSADNFLLFKDSMIIWKDNSTAINSIQTKKMSFGEPL